MLIVLDPEILKYRLLSFPTRRVIAFNPQLLVEVVYIQTVSRSMPCNQFGNNLATGLCSASPNRSMCSFNFNRPPTITSYVVVDKLKPVDNILFAYQYCHH